MLPNGTGAPNGALSSITRTAPPPPVARLTTA